MRVKGDDCRKRLAPCLGLRAHFMGPVCTALVRTQQRGSEFAVPTSPLETVVQPRHWTEGRAAGPEAGHPVTAPVRASLPATSQCSSVSEGSAAPGPALGPPAPSGASGASPAGPPSTAWPTGKHGRPLLNGWGLQVGHTATREPVTASQKLRAPRQPASSLSGV